MASMSVSGVRVSGASGDGSARSASHAARRARAETAARFASLESDAVFSASASAAARTDATSSFGRLDAAAAGTYSAPPRVGSRLSRTVSSASNRHASSAASSAVAAANDSTPSPRMTLLARISSHAGGASKCLAQCANTHAACARAARASAPPRGLRGGADGSGSSFPAAAAAASASASVRASLEAPWNANKHSAARSLVANPKRVASANSPYHPPPQASRLCESSPPRRGAQPAFLMVSSTAEKTARDVTSSPPPPPPRAAPTRISATSQPPASASTDGEQAGQVAMTRLANPTRTSLDARASAASPMAGPKGVASPRTVARSADDADASASAVSASSALDSDASELNFERTRWSSATTAETWRAASGATRARDSARRISADAVARARRGAAPFGSAASTAARSVAESTRSREPPLGGSGSIFGLAPPARSASWSRRMPAPTAASHEGDAVADAAPVAPARRSAPEASSKAAEGAAARDAASA